ncbi:hypothetical protein CFN78_09750 [Amycolatopsis antarctica]|uniref:Uncharacterized protein n=1 Tax=Amycolatopsis antarctica TaxID=1854586 RepID=A0A263D6Q5_9PSEU|nr:hypothetical protein [Amycolatopsis antarctica]OZM73156.1 hypothetical protein CFN78_09750 [Amycolatopsis antarctica]
MRAETGRRDQRTMPPRLVAGLVAALTSLLAWLVLAGGSFWLAEVTGLFSDDRTFAAIGVGGVALVGTPVTVLVAVLIASVPRPGPRPARAGVLRALLAVAVCLVVGGLVAAAISS